MIVTEWKGLTHEQQITANVVSMCILPGVPRMSWGASDRPWTSIRDALGTDEGFRLSVEWGSELWLEAGEGCLGHGGTTEDPVHFTHDSLV